MIVRDLGIISYREAWRVQQACHERVLAGGEEELLLLEHLPVITLGRRAADSRKHLLVSEEELVRRGVEVVESDRGGDITFHGPGQLVAYPTVRLAGHRLSVGAFVRRLEDVVIGVLGELGIAGVKDESAIGVWVNLPPLAKICALGVRIKRGVSMHGIALNVSTDMGYFELIDACGLGRAVTRVADVLGEKTPAMAEMKEAVARRMKVAMD